MKTLGFNIVLLGMIAYGKDTQANILKEKFSLKLVETGAYTRKLLKEKNKEGEIARQTAGKGKPLLTKLMQKFLIKKIENKPKNKNLLFLGGRLKPEAQLLKKLLEARKEKLIAFYIKIPDKVVYKRSLARKKSKVAELYKIFDEKEIIKKRIKWHKEQVGKTIKYYQKLGLMHIINGNQPIPKVTKDILEEIEKLKTKND